MRDLIQRLLSYNCKLRRLQRSSSRSSTRGFTLIELLVALVVASIMISSLLGFMVNILTTDRREQVKTATEHEMQGALDYIARDLEQAVYIYDAEGLQTLTAGYSTTTSTEQSQLPAGDDKIPVLVFWKRHILRADQDVTVEKGSKSIGCLVELEDLKGKKGCNNQDYQVYSLVAYYLMKDATCNPSGTWSCASQIGRFEIRDGILDEARKPTSDTAQDDKREEDGEQVYYDLQPSDGFQPFTLEGSLKASMEAWEKHPNDYEDGDFQVLIDYIDQTTIVDGANPKHRTQEECQEVFGVADQNVQMVPNYESYTFDSITLDQVVPDAFKTGSFYACVDSSRTLAKVFIRGNSKARTVANGKIATQAKYQESASAFFPTANIQVQGRGLLNLERN